MASRSPRLPSAARDEDFGLAAQHFVEQALDVGS
jgi:hypothetical protein